MKKFNQNLCISSDFSKPFTMKLISELIQLPTLSLSSIAKILTILHNKQICLKCHSIKDLSISFKLSSPGNLTVIVSSHLVCIHHNLFKPE